MNEYEYTRGPWRYEAGSVYGPDDVAGSPITILRLRPRQIPDGHLMAAAPDLLEALQEARRLITEAMRLTINTGREGLILTQEMNVFYGKSWLAIAKATEAE